METINKLSASELIAAIAEIKPDYYLDSKYPNQVESKVSLLNTIKRMVTQKERERNQAFVGMNLVKIAREFPELDNFSMTIRSYQQIGDDGIAFTSHSVYADEAVTSNNDFDLGDFDQYFEEMFEYNYEAEIFFEAFNNALNDEYIVGVNLKDHRDFLGKNRVSGKEAFNLLAKLKTF
jgi:hypothetical protein